LTATNLTAKTSNIAIYALLERQRPELVAMKVMRVKCQERKAVGL
jgi:hypothetical protein